MRREITQGAEAHGFSGDFWTLSRLTIAVKRWTGVADEDRSVWHLLGRLGFSCQKPLKRAWEAAADVEDASWRSRAFAVIYRGLTTGDAESSVPRITPGALAE